MNTPLQAARDHLNDRSSAADDAGDWAERMLLSNLYDVADYMCRIGDHDGRHYHADKSGPLVHAAMRVRKIALERYGGMFDRDVDHDPAYEAIEKATELLLDVDTVVAHVMWRAARSADGAELYQSDARELLRTVGDLQRWATEVAASAVPDPVDE